MVQSEGIHREQDLFSRHSTSLEDPSPQQRADMAELAQKYRSFLTKQLSSYENLFSDDLEQDQLHSSSERNPHVSLFKADVVKYLLDNLERWSDLDTYDQPNSSFSSAGKVQMLLFKDMAPWTKSPAKRQEVLDRCFSEGTFLKHQREKQHASHGASEEVRGRDDVVVDDDEGYVTLTASLETKCSTLVGLSTNVADAEPEANGTLDSLGDVFIDDNYQIPLSELGPINWVYEGKLQNVAMGRVSWHLDRDGKDIDHGGYTFSLGGSAASTQWIPVNVFPAVARLCAHEIKERFPDSIDSARTLIQKLQLQYLLEVDDWLQPESNLIQTIPPGNILADYSCFNKLFHRTNMDVSEPRAFFNVSESTFRKLLV